MISPIAGFTLISNLLALRVDFGSGRIRSNAFLAGIADWFEGQKGTLQRSIDYLPLGLPRVWHSGFWSIALKDFKHFLFNVACLLRLVRMHIKRRQFRAIESPEPLEIIVFC